MWIDLTTEDGELLKRVQVTISDDPFYPVGRGPARSALIAEIEAAARAARGREARASDRSPADLGGAAPACRTVSRILKRLHGSPGPAPKSV